MFEVSKYPKISKSWQEHLANLSTYFKYPLKSGPWSTRPIPLKDSTANVKSNQIQDCISDRRQPAKDALSGDDAHNQEMDRAP